jgi:N-acylneuraminate cytidylyltransferase
VPRKNLKLFHGKPIIAYSIENALQSGLFDEVYVSTDDDEIADLVLRYSVGVHRRPPCDGTLGTQEVTARVLESMTKKYDFACCLYATAPLLDASYLRSAYGALSHFHEFRFAFGVGTNPLRDAGQFYFGHTQAFLDYVPLITPFSAMIPIDERRVCDINTPEDWSRAEKMYEALHA